jgi:hypothetical protein
MEESMSRSAGLLDSITKRDAVDTRPGTLEFRAGLSGSQGASVDRRRTVFLSVTIEENQVP